jgi:hypothetical protein
VGLFGRTSGEESIDEKKDERSDEDSGEEVDARKESVFKGGIGHFKNLVVFVDFDGGLRPTLVSTFDNPESRTADGEKEGKDEEEATHGGLRGVER